ncbi:MAG TPA: sensor histidine kinase [Rectinemataceae bacterium]|nr:sensor histidine kinase [Rectinemataceae bacterium]
MSWRISWEGEDAEIEGDKAVDLGLLINELVMNSLKHAFPGGRTGSIFIEMRHDDEARILYMRLGDDGIGKTGGAATSDAGGGQGLKIIEAIARHLGAKMEQEEGPAFVYRFHFALGPRLRPKLPR